MSLNMYIAKAKRLVDDVNSGRVKLPGYVNPDAYHSRYTISPYHYGDPRSKPHYRVIMNWVERNLVKGSSILEVGCGLGLFGTWLRLRGFRNYTGVDINRLLVKIGRQVDTENNLLCMDGRRLDFKDGCFDFVGYINNFFDDDPPYFIKEGLRVAKQYAEWDGLDAEYLKQMGHGTRGYKSLISRREVLKLLEGWKVILNMSPSPDRRLYLVAK